jgi:integrase
MPRQPKQPGQPKRKKSTYGGGSVYYRKSDGRYVASIKDPGSGKRIERYAKSQKEAEKLLEDIKFEIRQGSLATGPRQTVKQFLERWFEDVHKFEVRQTTYITQLEVLNTRILPAIGHIQLQKLTAQHIQNFYAGMAKKGLRPGSIRITHTILHKALNQAVAWNLVSRNVCDAVALPKMQKYQPQMLTKDQLVTLLKGSKGHSLEAFIWMGLTLGLRNGELQALRWSDINLEERTLKINRTVTRLKGRYVEGDPKSQKSKRTIVLPRFLIESLIRHRQRQLSRRAKVGAAWQDLDLVFCNPVGGFRSRTSTKVSLDALLKKLGLPLMRVHDLRHNASTFLQMVLRVPAKMVQDILGHDDLEMTFDYTHTDLDMQREMMDDLDNFFNELN